MTAVERRNDAISGNPGRAVYLGRMRRLFAVGALVLAGCSVCTDLLYIPQLTFVLPQTEADALTADTSSVATCLNGTCWSNAFDPTGSNPDVTFDAQTRHLVVNQQFHDGGTTIGVNGQVDSTVSLTVSRDGGTLFTHEWTGVAFEAIEPNGQGCGIAYRLKEPLSL